MIQKLLITSSSLFVALLMNASLLRSQSICDSISFHSDTIYVNQNRDSSVRVFFNYNYLNNPSVAYPSYEISLNDTSNVIFKGDFLGTFLGQQDSIDFDITYKTSSLPNNFTLSGNFNVYDPNSTPNLICQFPIVFIFNNFLFVPEDSMLRKVSVYPNPFLDKLSIDGLNSEFAEIIIFDLLGKEWIRKSITNQVELNVSFLPSGFYMLFLRDNKDFVENKIIIKAER